MFNEDYTKVAVNITTTDNQRHVGFVDMSGNMQDLSLVTGANDFGTAARNESHAVFQPGAERIWFEDEAAEVFSQATDGSTRTAMGKLAQGPGSDFAVWRSGKLLDGLIPGPGQFALTVVDNDSSTLAVVTDSGRVVTTTAIAAGGSCPKIYTWIDDNRILCSQSESFGHLSNTPGDRFALCTIDAQLHVQCAAILPTNDRLNYFPVSDGSNVAFISLRGADSGLYVASLAGGSPTKIGPAPQTDQSVYSFAPLLSWSGAGTG
jgi:hypothetical protein